MSERTLALKLNGAEVRTALTDKMKSAGVSEVIVEIVDQALKRDWSMNPATAYDWFDGTISVDGSAVTVDLSLHDSGQDFPLKMTLVLKGEAVGVLQEPIEIPLGKAPPNAVRVETGQAVPSLAKQGDGPAEVKGIKYKRDAAPRSVTEQHV